MKAESTFSHLLDGFLLGPALNRNAVQGAHGSGAIRTMQAMDENGCALWVGCRSEENEQSLCVPGARLSCRCARSQAGFPQIVSIGMVGTEIYDRFNPHLFQALHTLHSGLSAPVQLVADLVEVGYPVELQGLCPGLLTVALGFRRYG